MNSLTNSQRWHIMFSGKVQHVGFRYTALYLARSLYLTGWVRNLPDGRVEVEVQGKTSCLRQFLIRLKSQPHLHIESADLSVVEEVRFDRHFRVLN